MSSSTSDSNIPNPFVNTASVSSLPTSGSTFGALKYNINEKLGWILGAPTPTDIYLYSDLYFNGAGGYYDILSQSGAPLFTTFDTSYPDQTLVKAVSTFMTYGDWTIATIMYDPKDYVTAFASKDGLMGMSWLPWDVYGLKGTDGNYYVKHYYNNSQISITCNPMRKEVLFTKLLTLLKIFGIGFGLFALLKISYKLIEKHEK